MPETHMPKVESELQDPTTIKVEILDINQDMATPPLTLTIEHSSRGASIRLLNTQGFSEGEVLVELNEGTLVAYLYKNGSEEPTGPAHELVEHAHAASEQKYDLEGKKIPTVTAHFTRLSAPDFWGQPTSMVLDLAPWLWEATDHQITEAAKRNWCLRLEDAVYDLSLEGFAPDWNFVAHINREEAVAWVKTHRPHILL